MGSDEVSSQMEIMAMNFRVGGNYDGNEPSGNELQSLLCPGSTASTTGCELLGAGVLLPRELQERQGLGVRHKHPTSTAQA